MNTDQYISDVLVGLRGKLVVMAATITADRTECKFSVGKVLPEDVGSIPMRIDRQDLDQPPYWSTPPNGSPVAMCQYMDALLASYTNPLLFYVHAGSLSQLARRKIYRARRWCVVFPPDKAFSATAAPYEYVVAYKPGIEADLADIADQFRLYRNQIALNPRESNLSLQLIGEQILQKGLTRYGRT